jgi:hypothetical protein
VNGIRCKYIEFLTGANEITKFYLNEHYGEIKRRFTSTSMQLLVKEHLVELQVDIALGECRRDYEIRI